MTRNKPWTAVSKALAAVTVILIATLVLAGGAAASTYKTLHTFTWAKTPWGNLILDAAGNLYGTTYDGGCDGLGTVFKLEPNPDGTYWKVSILHSFTGTGGANPAAGLIFDASGNLYGTAVGGGAYGAGTVFELSPTASGDWTEKILHNLGSGEDGANPYAGLIFDASGNLFGTAVRGGAYGAGTVFELSPAAGGDWAETILHNFGSGDDGASPAAGLIFDASGNLYGTNDGGGAYGAGAYGAGTVFELSPTASGEWTEKILYNFQFGNLCTTGCEPNGIIFDGSGNIYGTTYSGGTGAVNLWSGTVFELSPTASGDWTEKILANFSGSDGSALWPG